MSGYGNGTRNTGYMARRPTLRLPKKARGHIELPKASIWNVYADQPQRGLPLSGGASRQADSVARTETQSAGKSDSSGLSQR